MLRVVLVDDDPGEVRLVRETLRDADIELELATHRDGASAIRALENTAMPDVIIMDVNMPALDGHETVAELRRRHGDGLAPVVMLTTSDMPKDIEQGVRNQAVAYIRKPLTPENLFGALRGSGDAKLSQWVATHPTE